MFHVEQFRAELLRPALLELGEWTMGAEELLVLTCAAESQGGTYLKKIGGHGIGIFDLQPVTYHEIWDSYISKHSSFAYKLLQSLGRGCKPKPELMGRDLIFACQMARLAYLRFREEIPAATDIEGLAKYYVKYWANISHDTILGDTVSSKETFEKAIFDYNRFIGKVSKSKK